MRNSSVNGRRVDIFGSVFRIMFEVKFVIKPAVATTGIRIDDSVGSSPFKFVLNSDV